MRVYVPDKKDSIIKEVLKEIYLLRQEIVHRAGNIESKLSMIDKIRSKLQDVFEAEND